MTSRWQILRCFRPRFSLRAFLFGFALVCMVLGWRAHVINQVERPIRAITNAGGVLEYPAEIIGFANPGGPIVKQVRRRSYLEKFFLGYRSDDLPDTVSFGTVRSSRNGVDPSKVDDAFVAEMAGWINQLPSINSIDLSNTRVTAKCCSTLASIPQLREVWMWNVQITDAEVNDFGLLLQVEELRLWDTPLSKDALEEIEQLLPQCEIHHQLLW